MVTTQPIRLDRPLVMQCRLSVRQSLFLSAGSCSLCEPDHLGLLLAVQVKDDHMPTSRTLSVIMKRNKSISAAEPPVLMDGCVGQTLKSHFPCVGHQWWGEGCKGRP